MQFFMSYFLWRLCFLQYNMSFVALSLSETEVAFTCICQITEDFKQSSTKTKQEQNKKLMTSNKNNNNNYKQKTNQKKKVGNKDLV